jgi:hypothetical protein
MTSLALKDLWVDSQAVTFSVLFCSVMIFTAFVFLVYDMLVTSRQRKVVASADRTNAIVSSLFPKNVRDRLLRQGKDDQDGGIDLRISKIRMNNFLNDGNKQSVLGSEPIADLFPSAVR